mgnify:FL=1
MRVVRNNQFLVLSNHDFDLHCFAHNTSVKEELLAQCPHRVYDLPVAQCFSFNFSLRSPNNYFDIGYIPTKPVDRV